MKLNIAIIDDDPLAAKAVEEVARQIPEINHDTIQVYHSTVEALHGLKNHPVDLALMDVELDYANAFEVMDSLAQSPPVVLISSYEQYAVQAFDYDVIDYIVKPLSLVRLSKAVRRLEERAAPVAEDGRAKHVIQHLFLRLEDEYKRLPIEDIYWLEADGEHTKIGLRKDVLLVSTRIKQFQDNIEQTPLIRVHRSFIVNVNHIDQFQDDTVKVNNKVIPISRSNKGEFMRAANFVK